METKRFSGRAVLQAYTGCLLTELGDMYLLLNHCTRDDLMTHQLPRVHKEVRPWLARWFPEMEIAGHEECLQALRASLEGVVEKDELLQLVDEWYHRVAVCAELKEWYDVPQIPVDDHDVVHPLEEQILHGKEVVVVQTEE